MAHPTWKDEFSVGVASMDEDHKRLLEITGRLHEALSTGAERQVPLRICDELIEHSLVHFEHEEQWFDSLNYPRAAQHRRMHDKLKQRIVQYREQLGAELLSGEDRSYGAWLNAQGIH